MTRFAPFGLHNVALPSVPASHSAKAPFCAGHRYAPYRVEGNGHYAKSPTLSGGYRIAVALTVRCAQCLAQ